MQCNIDSRGKAVRLIAGAVVVLTGTILLFAWAVPTGAVPAWIVAILCLVAGGFMIFESRAGWCVVRAMGFKTPI